MLSILICRYSSPALIETFDTFRREVVTVGNQAGDHAADANVVDDLVQLGVHHRFAAGDGDDRRSEVSQFIEPRFYDVEINRFRVVIVFVAIATGEIATAHWDQVRENRMPARKQCA